MHYIFHGKTWRVRLDASRDPACSGATRLWSLRGWARMRPGASGNIGDSQWFTKEVREKCQKNHRKIWWLTYFWLASDFWHLKKSQTLLSRPAMSRSEVRLQQLLQRLGDRWSAQPIPAPGPRCPDGHPGRRWRLRTSPGVSGHDELRHEHHETTCPTTRCGI